MELRQLRSFVTVCEVGSLLQASARLHVAQPALGQQIAALEHDLGTRLFERSSRGMQPTEAGKVFLQHAQLVLADVERARMAVRASTAVVAGEVAIGLPTTVSLIATTPILQACRQQLPQVRLKIVEAYSGFLREWLLSGRLDLALLFGEPSDVTLARQPLLEDRLALITSPHGSPLPRSVGLTALADWPLVLPGREHGLRRIIDEACAPHGVALHVVAEIESLPSVKKAVQARIGSTILPMGAVAEEVADGQLRAAEIDSPLMARRVVCATNLARPPTAAARAVGDLVQHVVHGMVASGAWPARWIGRTGAAPQSAN
ncbi:MAG: transcriptional regulator [Variovorax paradoxus]|jgi:LysR family nitrogen assimilation transcriptional regulator|nr:MAG: transcriptional regulator [Variovorax paradoxus]PZQ12230.1 MAG: transcriptional regulator [Variovorax paradoxus]